MENDLGINALCKHELTLVEPYGGDLKVLCIGPWKAYGNKHCQFIFQYLLSTDLWIGHMYVEPDWRGQTGLKAAKEALRLFFQDTDAGGIYGLTPIDKKPALVFARALGFEEKQRSGGIVVSILTKENFKYGC